MRGADWRPVASRRELAARAALNVAVRAFFADRDLLEVETPVLSHSTSPEAHVRRFHTAGKPVLFLTPSPEFHMKRLLAAGSGDIFQICKAFRDGEAGARHNPEFSILEWYRTGFSREQLMHEVTALMMQLNVLTEAPEQRSFRSLFTEAVGIDPLTGKENALRRHPGAADTGLESRADLVDWLFARLVEPQLKGGLYVTGHPPWQASLAAHCTEPDGVVVADRFELVIDGLEIANGYRELTDAGEQRRRLQQDTLSGASDVPPLDEWLLAALQHGLPPMAGVAVGLDRVLMRQLGVRDLRSLLAFPFDRA